MTFAMHKRRRVTVKHVLDLISNLAEVELLLQWRKVASTKAGVGKPKPSVEVLNKSAVVLAVACWEAYVEDLATAAWDALSVGAQSPSVFPKRVLVAASKRLVQDGDERHVWELAGEGWKRVLSEHRAAILEAHVGKLNTPRPKQVDSLFEGLIGLPSLSDTWKWKGMSNGQAKTALETLVETRGSIAHRVKAAKYVRKTEVTRATELIQRLAAISSNRVRTYIMTRVGSEPWSGVRYRWTR